jgi:hypothetical protein
MLRRAGRPSATLDDVVELLTGIGQVVMGISVRLEQIVAILLENDEEDDS